MFAHVFKEYVSQEQRNLFEAERHGWHPSKGKLKSKKPIPGDVLDEFHEKSKGHMTNKDLPRKV